MDIQTIDPDRSYYRDVEEVSTEQVHEAHRTKFPARALVSISLTLLACSLKPSKASIGYYQIDQGRKFF